MDRYFINPGRGLSLATAAFTHTGRMSNVQGAANSRLMWLKRFYSINIYFIKDPLSFLSPALM